MRWKYHNPVFSCDEMEKVLLRYSPWAGHRRFVYDFTMWKKPKKIAELGSYYGCSAFTFLQAVKDAHLDTEFYAVDTWGGDDFTANDYKENIYEAYKEVETALFQQQNCHTLRMTFDEAVSHFEDGSLDILHIDGSHHYEDVKHDFETWKDKVKSDGIVLFHDISEEEVCGEKLGSSLFWQEIKAAYPYTRQADYSFGLGILFFKKEDYQEFCEEVDLNYYSRLNYGLALEYKDQLRKDFFKMRDLNAYLESLKEQQKILQMHLQKYESDNEVRNGYIAHLEEELKETVHKFKENLNGKERYIEELETAIGDYQKMVEGKDNYMKELETSLRNQQEKIGQKDSCIAELQTCLDEWKLKAQEREEALFQLQQEIIHYKEDTGKKDARIDTLEGTIRDYEKTVSGKDAYIKSLEEAIKNYEENVRGKDAYIESLRATIKDYEENVHGKDTYIGELQATIRDYEESVHGKDTYIQELQNTIQEYEKSVCGKDAYIKELEEKEQQLLSVYQRLNTWKPAKLVKKSWTREEGGDSNAGGH